jgi:uncharacterized RDD family membrane protein YckC
MYIASTKKRVLAYLFDQVMTYIFYLPLILKVGIHYLKSGHEVLIPWSWIISITGLHMIFQVICLYVLNGSPAQWLLGLRVVSTYHPELGLSLSQCFIHVIGDKLKFFIGNALYYSAFWDRDRRHFINLLAETKIVQKEPFDALLKPRLVIGSILFVIAMASSFYENIGIIEHSKLRTSGWIIEDF